MLIGLILLIATGLYLGLPFGIRSLGKIPFRWTTNPANTFALVVTHSNDPRVQDQGGNIVDILHGINGKRLVRKGADPLDWYFKKGTDPSHQNFFFTRLGVQDMGSIFYTLRTNIDKRMRFSREKDKPTEDLHSVTREETAKHIFFTGDLTVVIKEADTADNVYLDFEIDFIFERTFPARSIIHLGDAAAFLTSLVKQMVNNETSIRPVLDYYGGPDTKTHRQKLAEDIHNNPDFQKKVLRELGLDITSVSIRDVAVDPEYRELFALDTKAEKKGEAELIAAQKARLTAVEKATGEMEAENLRTSAKKRLLDDVTIPAAASELTLAAFAIERNADAYAKNTTVTTYAPGKDTVGALPLSK